MAPLEGRAALVTGGSRRIGRAIALGLARAGADVAISYRGDAASARLTADRIEALGRDSVVLRADLARPADCRKLVDGAARALGRLDVLVNNAGEWLQAPVARMDLRAWRGVIDSNLTATFLCSKHAIPHMRRRRWGRIVNLAAAGAYRAHGSAGLSAFYAAKAGVVALTKSLAREVGRYGITVNAVAPGIIEAPELSPAEAPRRRDVGSAVGRPGTGADVAAAVLFLASDDASYITGDVLGVTGGFLL